MENYTSDNINPTSVFMVQAGFVDGIMAEPLSFHSIETAFENLFRNNKEFCMIVWNEIPFRLNYHEDIPFLIPPLTQLLGFIFYSEEENHDMTVHSKNCHFSWSFSRTENDSVFIGEYKKIPGNHENALNSVGKIQINTTAFLREWKLLIQQILTAFHQSEYQLTRAEDQKIIDNLTEINDFIPQRALRYQYDER